MYPLRRSDLRFLKGSSANLSADTIYVNLDYTALGTGKDITTVEKLTPELMETIMEESTTLQGMYLRASGFQEVTYNSKKQSANLVGVTPGYAEISNISFEQGTDFGEIDFEDGEQNRRKTVWNRGSSG